MNKKPTILAVAALGSLALIGTGFAGWVIAANAETSAEGTITAYEVTDNRLEIVGNSGSWDANHGSIVFGKPNGYTKGSEWFFAADDVAEEILKGTYSLTVKSKNASDNGNVKVSCTDITVQEDTNDVYKGAINKGLITKPTITIKSGETSVDNGGTVALAAEGVDLAFTVQFGWGSHFGGENPYAYYKDKGVNSTISEGTSETYGDDALASLQAIKGLNGLKFSFTISLDRAEA